MSVDSAHVSDPAAEVSLTPLSPFGLLVEAAARRPDLRRVPPARLTEWAARAPVLVLRGFPVLDVPELVEYCAGWGEILQWDFGPVLDLVVHESPRNYLFTRGEVPFHWDGAFADATPSYLFFQCVEAPRGGGQTLFCDTTRVFRQAPADRQEAWRGIGVTYRTEKVEHYGGQVTLPLVSTHPRSGAPTMRYAEPLDPEVFLNPLALEVHGVPPGTEDAFIEDMRTRLYRLDVCYAHTWRDGDIVIADNHALLHARRPFTTASARRLQRVHIL